MTPTPSSWSIEYQLAADKCFIEDYTDHAQAFIGYLSDEINIAYRKNTHFPVKMEEVLTGQAFFLFDMREVPTPPNQIETHTYLLKESRIAGAYGFSCTPQTKRPSSRTFAMSNMYGRTEEAFGKSYDKGHLVCHGAGGGADWNLFPQLRSLNRGWTQEGMLYRKMEAYVAGNQGTMFFSRPIYLDGSVCPSLLEYGVLMPDRKVWWTTFSNVPVLEDEGYGRKKKVPMPPELAGIPNIGRKRKKAADESANP